MDILMAFDGNYAMPAAVAARSLTQSLEGDEPVCFHVLDAGISHDDRASFCASVPEPASVHWYDFDASLVSSLPAGERSGSPWINRTAYAILFWASYLPPSVRRVLFVDGDTLIRESVRPLWEHDLGDSALAACRDLSSPAIASPMGVTAWRELGLDGRLPYFNSGVMLIDRERWVREKVESAAVEYLDRYAEQVIYYDQSALNAVLAGGWTELSLRWNYLVNQEVPIRNNWSHAYAYVDAADLDRSRADPAIVHFAGPFKPWKWEGRELPFTREWQVCLDETSWSGQRPVPPPTTPAWRRLRGRVRRALRALVRSEP